MNVELQVEISLDKSWKVWIKMYKLGEIGWDWMKFISWN